MIQKIGLDGETVDFQCHLLFESAIIEVVQCSIGVNSLGQPDLGYVDRFYQMFSICRLVIDIFFIILNLFLAS